MCRYGLGLFFSLDVCNIFLLRIQLSGFGGFLFGCGLCWLFLIHIQLGGSGDFLSG